VTKKTLILIAGGTVVLLLIGFLIYNGIQKAQVRSWIEDSIVLEFNAASDSGNVYFAGGKMPAKLRTDEDVSEAYEDLREAVSKYNNDIKELDQNVEELIQDLSTYGKDMHYRAMTIPVLRYGVEVGWFSVQAQYSAYTLAMQSYWIEHYPNDVMPLADLPNCNFVYTVDEVIPENARIHNTNTLYGLSKRTCTYDESSGTAGQDDAPQVEPAEEAVEPEAELAEQATSTPSPTPQPLYSTTANMGFDWGYTSDNGDSIYVVKPSGSGQKVVAYDVEDDGLNLRVLFQIEPSPLNDQKFIVSADEQYILSNKKAWLIESGEKIAETEFPILALSPDNTQLVGYQLNRNEGPSYPVVVYDFPGLNPTRDLLLLEAPDGRAIDFNWQAFSSSGKYFALSYLIRSIENGSTDPVDSGLLVWETQGWTQVANEEGDGATLYDQGVFSADDNFLAVSVKTFEPGDYLYSPYTRVEIFNLNDPQAITSLSYTMQTPNVSALALGPRADSQFALACRTGNSQQVEIEVVDAASGEQVDSETIEDLFWPYFTRSGILYGTGYGTRQPFLVYLPSE